jgi:hypothetical protein
MIKLILISLLHLTACHRLRITPVKTKIYKFNLDLPINDRYRQVITDFKDSIVSGAKLFERNYPSFALMANIDTQVTKQSPDWLAYMQLVSEITGLTIKESVMLSSAYELGCTSVLARDINDKIIFGRNLDFQNTQILTHGVYEADYYKNNQLVYKGVEIAGFFGSLNSVKPGKFAISLNIRFADLNTNIQRIFDGYRTPAYNLMKVMETAKSYDEAVGLLSNTPLTTDVYYTIASSDNGCIITRDYADVVRVDKLEGDKWFLVITNADFGVPDYRRQITEERINRLGQKSVDYNSLFSIMNKYPTNDIETISTSIQTASGYLDTTVYLDKK